MIFILSKRSLDKLEGVDDRLQEVVREAIGITKVDFGVIEGVRSIARQKRLVNNGASHTMQSKHLEGKAVDLLAYADGDDNSIYLEDLVEQFEEVDIKKSKLKQMIYRDSGKNTKKDPVSISQAITNLINFAGDSQLLNNLKLIS